MAEEITPQDVEELEKLADLKLQPERRSLVAGLLSAWVPAANELNRKMAQPQYRGLTPNLRFTHPGAEEVSE